MNRTNNKMAISKNRWNRIRMMEGNVHGYMYTFANGTVVRGKSFLRGDYVYGVAAGKNGQTLYLRYHKDCYHDFWAFREDETISPHSPF